MDRAHGHLRGLSHGRHGREPGRKVRHRARGVRRLRARVAAALGRGGRGRPLPRGDRAPRAQEGQGGRLRASTATSTRAPRRRPSRSPSCAPVFKPSGGVVTAGNASGIADGAAALVVASRAAAERAKAAPLGALVSWAVVGVEPRLMGIRSRAGHREGPRARQVAAIGDGPDRGQRGLRPAVPGRRARGRPPARDHERRRGRHRARPPAGRIGSADRDAPALRAPSEARPIRARARRASAAVRGLPSS